MQLSILALCTLLCPRVLGHPYASETTCISVTTTSVENLWPVSEPTERHYYDNRLYYIHRYHNRYNHVGGIYFNNNVYYKFHVRNLYFDLLHLYNFHLHQLDYQLDYQHFLNDNQQRLDDDEYYNCNCNEQFYGGAGWGNITAIVFGCCMISLFGGISVIYCARDRARARRIAARKELESSSSDSKIPLVAAKDNAIADLEVNRSSMMFTNQPQTEYFPARSTPSVSNHHSHTTSATSQTTTSTRDHASRAHINEQNTPLV
ncbi:hypothetical protein PENFLA_c004G07956 [Penicillium flavigenum]|uniref:Uncharacterized protein n=1 Tax=Penicillium flavigenum TaxID=254877 RepID=A0A1V6TT74_9EURO|nr:hypothetical protein PENFLA_c004G07956 [Penicillium flavigenum]